MNNNQSIALAEKGLSSIAVFAVLGALGIALAAPFFFYPVFLMKALCFALFACAYNLLLGYGGMLSIGHAAFFGGSAYVAGYAMKYLGFPPELGILLGGGVGAALGLVIGWLAIQRSGIYLAMITLALAQIVFFAAVQLPFTGGEDGLQNIPRGNLFGLIDLRNDLSMYYLVLAVFVIGFYIIHRTIESPFGQVLAAVRDNESRATSLGYDINQVKLLVFIISAALAGVAGATKSIVFQLASLTDVNWHMSGEVILMTLIGGMGTRFGPVVGALIIVSLPTFFTDLGSHIMTVQGAIFILCVLLFRKGIVGTIPDLLGRWR
ncbi:branched-chain amino acid ABC transporter permease [Martelella sp. AMO21009]